MIGVLILGFVGIVGLIALTGWILAHARPAPAVVRDELGPVVRTFQARPADLFDAVHRTLVQLRGVRVDAVDGTTVTCSVRPKAGRLDDAMGLFVRIRVEPASSGSQYRVTGMARSSVGLASSSARALVGFERELRMDMKRTSGIAAQIVPSS